MDLTRSPVRAMLVLYHLSTNTSGASLASLSAALVFPKTSLLRLLRTLESEDYVRCSDGEYFLGASALKLGASIARSCRFPNCALPTMQRISDRCGETIILGVPADGRTEVSYAAVIDGTKPLQFIGKVGSVNPMYGSASGQVLLAFMSAADQERYLTDTKFSQVAQGTIIRKSELKKKLSSIAKEGVSVSVDGLVDGVYSVAAPIVSEAGEVIAGLSISAPAARGLRHEDQLRGLVLDGGRDISWSLGYQGVYPPKRR